MRKLNKPLKSNEDSRIRTEKRKQEALDTLEQDPNNLSAIKTMIKISRKEGDIEAERKYLYRRLELESNNPKIAMLLIRIAKANNNPNEVRILSDKIASMEIKERGQIMGAMSMAAKYRDTVLISVLKTKLKKLENKEKDIRESKESRRTIFVAQVRELEREDNGELQTFVERARRIIYESDDIVKGTEEIKKLLEGQDQTEAVLILAELYFHTGMRDRAEKSLKAYRSTLKEGTKTRDKWLVNQVIEIVRNKKTLPYNWEEFWKEKEKQKKTIPEAPSQPKAEGR